MLTREDLTRGIKNLENYLATGKDGKAIVVGTEEHVNMNKAIDVLANLLKDMDVAEVIVPVLPVPAVEKVKKERKPRAKKVKPELKWNKDNIKDLLSKYNTMVERSIVQLYERQTADEKQTASTNHENGIGFNGSDAPIMSSFAKQVMRGVVLSPKQLDIARPKIMKYAGQLAHIGNEIEATKAKGQ